MKTNAHILIVDDDTDILVSARILLKQTFSKISICNDPKELDERLTNEDIQAILLDMNYQKGKNDGREGVYWLKRIKEIKPSCGVIMMTAYGDVQKAVECLKNGAADYILKPWNASTLPQLIQSAIVLQTYHKPATKSAVNASKETTESQQEIITGKSMERVLKTIEKAAPTEANILLLGENGTGKQVFAEHIHVLSSRHKQTFIHVDLGSLSPTLFESTLFGHTKGAFTDAKENKVGYFEQAEGGTIFLDEIGNLPVELQAKLLQVLQSRVIYRLGAPTPIPINVRIICATNMDLNKMTQNGSFRQDLLYRINTISIELPPLRDRKEEIAPLANHFLQLYNLQYKQFKVLSDQTMLLLSSYHWPGNVRELMHVLERAVILSENETITPIDLNIELSNIASPNNHQQTLEIDQMEKALILKALHKSEGNITKAAAELGLAAMPFIDVWKNIVCNTKSYYMTKNFYWRTVFTTVIIVAFLLLGLFCIQRHYYFTAIGAFIVASLTLWNFLALTNRINRDVQFFLQNANNSDDTVQIKTNNYGKPFQLFFQTYKSIQANQQALTDENYRLQQLLLTILDKTSAGFIVIPSTKKEDIPVLYINRSALNLLDIPPLNNWSRITDRLPNLQTSVDTIITGGKTFLTIAEDKQLSIETQQILSNNQPLLLLTIQDIQSEMETKETDSWNKLIQVMTHEILNSLTPINTMSFILEGLSQQELLNDEDKEDLKIASSTIASRSKGLMQFVQDYRKVAELPVPTKTKTEIKPFLLHIIQLFNTDLLQKNIQIILDCHEEAEYFWIDQTQIEQALINLLSNAIYAVNNQSTPLIQLKVQHHIDSLQIVVTDNGKGITPEQQPQIFVPFYTTRNEGSGIGLSVVRNIMRMHNGSVTAYSSGEDRGSIFTLNFPYKY